MLVFAIELQIAPTTCISCNWGKFQIGLYVERGRKHWKIWFYEIYIEVKQLGHEVVKVISKIKCHESGSAQYPL